MRSRFRRYFRLPLRRRGAIQSQVDDEIALHIALRVEQLISRGLSRREAVLEAQRRFGPPPSRRRMFTLARRKERRMSFRESLEALRQDIRYVLRTLRLEPGFTATIVITLALGIGANAAMFGIIDRLLLRGPSHVIEPDRIQRLYYTSNIMGAERTFSTLPYIAYTTLRDGARTIERAAAYTRWEYTVGRGDGAERIDVGLATWDFFALTGVTPYRGRFFTEAEDLPPTGTKVAVLGHDFWRRKYQGDESIIGQTIELAGDPFTVIGIAPAGYTGVRLRSIGVWVPMAAVSRSRDDWPTTWKAQWLDVVVRLRPNTSPEAAGAEATALMRAAYTGTDDTWKTATNSLRPIHYTGSGEEPTEVSVTRWLMGVSVVVLLVACANVANLLLARVLRRRREIAVRVVLGITRGRLIRLLLTESLVLAALGAIAGLAIAYWGGQFARVALLSNIEWRTSPIDTRVLVFSLLAALATGVLIGLFPVLQALSHKLAAALKTGTREGGGRRSPVRSALTIAQAALSVVLLVGAGLFVKSLYQVRHLDLGIQPDRVLAISAQWPSVSNEEWLRQRASRDAIFDRALERVRNLPFVEHAATAVGTPFSTSFGVHLRVPGYDSVPELPGGQFISAINHGFFATVGTRLLEGRDFTPADRRGSERVVIVNQTMANTLWPNQPALGKCLILFADTIPCARVVGVVEESRRFALREDPAMQYYVPLGQEIGIGGRDLLVRPRGDMENAITELRRELQQLDPTVLYYDIRTLQEAVDPQIRPWKLGATMFAVFGGLALLIAAIGLYSVIAYLVSHRTRELGIRMALGARTVEIRRLILGQGVVLTLLGIAAGLLLALIGGRFVSDLLFDTSPRDPLVFTAVVTALLLSALIACLLPAWRAANVNPADALRAE